MYRCSAVSGSDNLWYRQNLLSWCLLPFAAVFCVAAGLRRLAYRRGWKTVHRLDVPVVVVGNITVGGTGKTPFLIWLVEVLRAAGYSPGIVSRGYGGRDTRQPMAVTTDSDPGAVGDEPVLLAQRCECPVVACHDRVAAARQLLHWHRCNIVLSDDGLQHYALGRDVEIAIVDASRRFGNGFCLPAGPLREPRRRLASVDLVIHHGAENGHAPRMLLEPECVVPLVEGGEPVQLQAFRGRKVHAVAGIGYPKRFFSLLARYGISVAEHPFRDHYPYAAGELTFGDNLPVLMTEKDAVKYRASADENHWFVRMATRVDTSARDTILALLKERTVGQETA